MDSVDHVQRWKITSQPLRVYDYEIERSMFVLNLCLHHNHRWGFYSSEGIAPFAQHPYRSFSKKRVYVQHDHLEDEMYQDLQRWEVCPSSAGPITEMVCGICNDAMQDEDEQNRVIEINVRISVETTLVYEDYLHQIALSESAEEAGFTIAPASISAVEALEKGVAMSEDGLSACTICTEGFVEGFEVTRMPCKHLFHSNCILPWLENKNSCPNCRAQI